MQSERIFIIWNCIRIRYEFSQSKSSLSPHHLNTVPTDRSSEIPLLLFFYVCVFVSSYVAIKVTLFVPYLSFRRCLGRAVLHDRSIS